LGLTLVSLGLLGLFYTGITALWGVLIGFFLYSGAVAEEQYARLQAALAGVTVRQVMTLDPPAVPGSSVLGDVLELSRQRLRTGVLVVTDREGSPTALSAPKPSASTEPSSSRRRRRTRSRSPSACCRRLGPTSRRARLSNACCPTTAVLRWPSTPRPASPAWSA
jgi:hypothetical protein